MKIKVFVIGLLIAASAGMNIKANSNLANMEAMFIYNFLRLVNWPVSDNNETFTIGVYGNSGALAQLDKLASNRKVGTRPIKVIKIASVEQAKSCQLVFVTKAQSSKIASIKSAIGNQATLLVSEKEGSNASGSTIEFVVKDNKLKFKIDENRAKQHNLVISNSLLDMAV